MKEVPQIKHPLNTVMSAPPSKAHSLRALLLSSLASGTSRIHHPLNADDQKAMIDCLERLGAKITIHPDDLYEIEGISFPLTQKDLHLHCRESGVTINFLTAIAAIIPGKTIIDGEPGLRSRPVTELVEGLRQQGVEIHYKGKSGYPPMEVSSSSIAGGTVTMSGSITSQYFSSLAIASVFAESDTRIVCEGAMREKPYFDITLEMMQQFGIEIQRKEYSEIVVAKKQKYKPAGMWIEGDYTSASYFLVAAAICGGSIEINRLKRDSSQGDRIIVDLMQKMGCVIKKEENKVILHSGELHPVDSDLSDNPDLVPSLAVASAFCNGTSIIRNIGHLRFKESDRIQSITSGLENMGVRTECTNNNLVIHGNPQKIHGARIKSFNDHRIAMSFAIAGLRTGNLTIDNEQCVEKSWPDFWNHLETLFNPPQDKIIHSRLFNFYIT